MMEKIKGPDYLTNRPERTEHSDQPEKKPERTIKNFYLDSEAESGESQVEISRRTLLKGALLVGAVWGIGKFFNSEDDEDKYKGLTAGRKEKSERAVGIGNKPTKEQIEIKEDNVRIIGKTIEAQLKEGDKVVLSLETKNAIRQRWEESYSKRPENCPDSDKEKGKNHLGLLESMEKMQPWISKMKNEFTKIGVPEKYVYLTIPESHFNLSAVSRAGAVGPFQFTPGTAKLFKLFVGDNIDDRCDPVESARACAEHLKYSHERFNNDWDLAFADYNGGFTNKYAKFRSRKEDRNYEDYLQWREDRINKFISQKHFNHKVKDGQTLTKIARNNGVSIDDLMKMNNLGDDKIKINQELKIPVKKSTKISKMRDSLENLNYPEKFYAVLDVIKKEDLEKRFPAQSLKYSLAEVPKNDLFVLNYTIRKGDGLLAIARRFRLELKKKNSNFNVSVNGLMVLIQEQNKIKKRGNIRIGQKIKLEVSIQENPSLASMAKKYNCSLTMLKGLNPAVVDSNRPLISGMKIRIPEMLESQE